MTAFYRQPRKELLKPMAPALNPNLPKKLMRLPYKRRSGKLKKNIQREMESIMNFVYSREL